MAAIVRNIYDFLTSPSKMPAAYDHMPSHGAIWPILLFNIIYISFVFRIGPWLMRNRKPFELQKVILVYNAVQIVYNIFMCFLGVQMLTIYLQEPSGLGCINQLPYGHPHKDLEVFCQILYFINKFADYLETIFFVLRKRYKQVSFLHVYHHIMMTTMLFVYMRYQGTGGHGTPVAVLNCFVHAPMYIYYLMSALQPSMKGSMWWKKYITQLQLLQFILDFIHQIWPIVIRRDCAYPKIWCLMAVFQAAIMIYLFGNFYIKTYVKKPKQKQT